MSEYSVKKPITVIMGILIVIVLGLFSVTRLPLTLFPSIELPFVVTITEYQGASPEEVEEFVTKKIESSVATIGNFSSVSSMSNEHFGVSIITFTEGSNMEAVVIEMRELLNNTTFPSGVGNTRILRISPDMLPVMTVTLYRSYSDNPTDEEALIRNTEWINKEILVDLQSIPGVADVSLSGAADIVLQVNLDSSKLPAGMTNANVLEVIENQNIGGLIGIALDSGELRMLYLGDKIDKISDIESLPIYFDGTDVITLKDLVVDEGIRFINANTNTYSKINNQQGIQVSFTKQSNYGITEVSNKITERLNDIIAREGNNANYEVLLDQGEYINRSIGSVLQNLIVGGILAIVILFVFLKDIKPTIIVGLAIPISVVGAFMLMYFSGLTLNLVSMGGLALGIGMLVDNSVVVIENIYRMIAEGKSRKEAAVDGAKQVMGAITASTITTVAVFLPIVFIEGFIADIFISMALTIAYSLFASLAIALTLVPMMASRMLEDKKPKKEGKFLTSIKNVYEKTVRFTIKFRKSTITVVFALLVLSTLLVTQKGFILLPQSDEGVISITINTSSQTSFQAKSAYTDYLTNQILELDDVLTVAGSIGGSSGFGRMFMAANQSQGGISLTINLKENRENSTTYNETVILDIIDKIKFDDLVGIEKTDILEVIVSQQNSAQALSGASGINIKVSGYNQNTLKDIADEIVAIIEGVEGVTKADNGVSQGADAVSIKVNQTNAMRFGLTQNDVQKNISYLYTSFSGLGATNSLNVTIEGVTYEVSLPSGDTGGFSFDLFGTYEDFLGNIVLFDQTTIAMIDRYLASNEGIYMFDPSQLAFGRLGLMINPYLRVVNGEIVFDANIMSPEVSLSSLVIAPLFDETPNSVTTVTIQDGFSMIRTDGTNRYLNVTAEIERGKNVTIVSEAVNREVNRYLNSDAFKAYGSGYSVTFEGENEEIMQAVGDLVIAVLVAILLVYMVMAIQFQSLIYPFIILGTIPLAFTGGMLALLITNQYLSLVSIMGLVILVGIVVNNGIVLIDYINTLRKEGYKTVDAIVEAGKTRLRPIFMTSLTTILGLFGLALGLGEGSELLQPMAITAIGGLIYATILTLIVIPSIYVLFNRNKVKKEDSFNDVN